MQEALVAKPSNYDESIRTYRAAIYFMAASMIGIGYLTLPKLCTEIGVLFTVLIVFICGLASLFGNTLLMNAYIARKNESYPDIVREILGKKHYIIIMITLILYVFFSTVVYAILCRLTRLKYVFDSLFESWG